MNAIEITILSIVLMIALGYVLKRVDFLTERDIDPLNKLVMNILMPCMVFSALYSADLSSISELGILPFVILASSTVTGIISFIILKKASLDDKTLWSVLVSVMIANTAFMGYPVNLGIFANAGFLRAIFCDLATLTMFLLLSFVLALKFGGTVKKALRTILLFPTLWAVILGILFNYLSIPIGPVLENVVGYLGDGAIPIIMIALGLSINFKGFSKSKYLSSFVACMKLLFFPAVAFVVVTLLNLSGLDFTVGVVEAAMPSGMMSLLLSITYKLDFHLTSDCILLNTVISLLTLPVIISLV